MSQMKEQDKTQEKQLNEVEIGNLPEKEFRIMIVKIIQDLRKGMEAKIENMQEMFTKDLEELKNKQTEMTNLPGSVVHGILQARILEWTAISFSRGSFQPRDRTRISCIADRRFTVWATSEALTNTPEGINSRITEVE